MRIAYQGVTGAYSEAAALQFNPSADPLPRPSFDDVFNAVARREATHGILPIENTIGGTIHPQLRSDARARASRSLRK